jgi:hypothetical protein
MSVEMLRSLLRQFGVRTNVMLIFLSCFAHTFEEVDDLSEYIALVLPVIEK